MRPTTSGTRAKTIDTAPIDRPAAAAIEAAEARAWADLYAAAPPEWAAEVDLGWRQIGAALVLHWGATGRRYFSRAIGLGVIAPASEAALDAILGLWRERGIEMFLLQSLPHCLPEGYEAWLRDRGLEPFDAQDRIVRGDEPLPAPLARSPGVVVERVGVAGAEEWSRFLQRVYGLDTGPWLPRLIERPGWSQYVARAGGEIVGARGSFIGADGLAWLGMEGPVPGITTEDYEPDAVLCARIVADGLRAGARGFIADIEAPSPQLDTPAYGHFARLGFRRPYVRTHWTVP
ncbi:MAG: hypothetical protein ACOYD4_01505 [Solirubrobacterales bacterium]